MVRLAGVKAIRYIGVQRKKLWEVGGRNVPILDRGDVVLVDETVALGLCRSRFFELCEVEITANVAPLEDIVIQEDEALAEEVPAQDDDTDTQAQKKKGK